jgi:hypothetical protein
MPLTTCLHEKKRKFFGSRSHSDILPERMRESEKSGPILGGHDDSHFDTFSSRFGTFLAPLQSVAHLRGHGRRGMLSFRDIVPVGLCICKCKWPDIEISPEIRKSLAFLPPIFPAPRLNGAIQNWTVKVFSTKTDNAKDLLHFCDCDTNGLTVPSYLQFLLFPYSSNNLSVLFPRSAALRNPASSSNHNSMRHSGARLTRSQPFSFVQDVGVCELPDEETLRAGLKDGNPEAQYIQAVFHYKGSNATLDWDLAHSLMKKSAEQGYPRA